MSGMSTSWRWWLGMTISGIGAFFANSAVAQITPDSTLTNNSSVTINGSTFNITGGTQAGRNLFHSFGQFSVPTGGTASFNNGLDIQNIISRVTGRSGSIIDGLIRANGGANLFIINPSGIVFGKNASLNIGGSFVTSTASSLKFADGFEFSAATPQTTPLLTISIPIGLQFGTNPGRILVQGDGRGLRSMNAPVIDTNVALRVESNQTLALVGGNLTLEGGTLKTAGGRIELGSVAEPGLVTLTAINKGFSLGYDQVSSYGDIQLTRASAVDASGVGGGNIQVWGRQVIVKDGSQIQATTLRTAPGGTLTVNASELVKISGSTADNPQDNRSNPSYLATDNREAGKIPGELTINTKRLIVDNGARISASNTSDGLGGNINVNATEEVQLIGTGVAPGGLRSSGLSVQTRGSGNAGNLTINTKRLIIKDGAEASASTFSEGNGGTVTVKASDLIELSGTSTNGQLRSRLVSGVGEPADVLRNLSSSPLITATGPGGNLMISTEQLTVSNGAVVAVSSRSNAINAKGAGNLEITAKSIRLNNQGTISAETLSGLGGNISLQVEDFLLLRRNSRISATAGTAQKGGNSGNITINAANGFIIAVPSENSDITANAFSGSGGKVEIQATGIYGIAPLSRQDLEKLRPLDLDPSKLSTNDITAISQQNPSLNGRVTVNTPDIDPTRGLVQLPTVVVNTPRLTPSSCAAFDTGGSSFTVTGRGGLPPSPDEPLTNDVVWSDTRLQAMSDDKPFGFGGSQSTGIAKTATPSPLRVYATPQITEKPTAKSKVQPIVIAPATGWVFHDNGEVTLISNASGTTSLVSTPSTCPIR